MAKLRLHTAKAIPGVDGVPVYADAGTELEIPSDSVTLAQAQAWVDQGGAIWVAEPPAAEPRAKGRK